MISHVLLWASEYSGAAAGYLDDSSVSETEIGLNLGAGANFNKFFGEVKYDTKMEQLALTVGILF